MKWINYWRNVKSAWCASIKSQSRPKDLAAYLFLPRYAERRCKGQFPVGSKKHIALLNYFFIASIISGKKTESLVSRSDLVVIQRLQLVIETATTLISNIIEAARSDRRDFSRRTTCCETVRSSFNCGNGKNPCDCFRLAQNKRYGCIIWTHILGFFSDIQSDKVLFISSPRLASFDDKCLRLLQWHDTILWLFGY